MRRSLRHQAVLGLITTAALCVPAPAAAVGPGGRPLYITNSGAPNISIYAIGPTGVPIPVGDPVPTGDETRGIVFSPDGRVAYVGDSGINAVAAFTVGDRGRLTRLGDPAPTGGEFPFGLAIAPNGRTVYAANLGSGTVAALRVGHDGSLTLLDTFATGVPDPKGVAVTPDGRLLFVSHGSPGDPTPDVLVTFAIGVDGRLTPSGRPVGIGASGAGVAVSPDGRFVYVACQQSDDVHGFRVGPNGELTPVPGSPFGARDFAEGVVVSPNGRHLYVTSVGSEEPDRDGVWAFAIGADGALTPAADRPFPADEGPVGITPTPDGRRLYVSNFRSHTVSAFDVVNSGGLRPIGMPVDSRGTRPAFQSAAVLPNQGPRASFSALVRPPGQPTRFDASASVDRDGRIARYDWDFGDGTALANGGPTPAHVYSRPGTYRVTLTVTDDEGCSVRFVYTGQSTLCNGSTAARAVAAIVVER